MAAPIPAGQRKRIIDLLGFKFTSPYIDRLVEMTSIDVLNQIAAKINNSEDSDSESQEGDNNKNTTGSDEFCGSGSAAAAPVRCSHTSGVSAVVTTTNK